MTNFKRRPIFSNITHPEKKVHIPDNLNDLLAEIDAWIRSQYDNNTANRQPKSRGVDLFNALLRYRKDNWNNLSTFLPILLQLDNKPYSLANHVMMEPLFSLNMPDQLVLKCGRQISKSSSFAATIVLHSIAIPGFDTLYVAPLQEHTRKFARNYLAPFLDTMTLQNLNTTGQSRAVLQRTLSNGSIIYCHYAYTSAERIRGVPVDKVVLDETVAGTCRVDTYSGPKFIFQIKVGDLLASFDSRGNICWDEVVSQEYHGFRACFRLTLDDGRYVEATSESWIRTNLGWMRVSQIIDYLYAEQQAGVEASRNNAREQANVGTLLSAVPEQPQVGTTQARHFEVPDLIRVRTHAHQEEEEQRLRGVLELFQYPLQSGLRLYRSPVLSICDLNTKDQIRLEAAEIISVEYTGFHHVYDIETRHNKSFLPNGIAVHNCQMMDWDLMPIIFETLSASRWFLKFYSGTPSTFDNTLERLWKQSSRAEWVIPCRSCRHNNYATIEDGVLDMIQNEGLCCVKCRAILNPGDDSCHWVHRVPEKFRHFQGYHVPQVILPMHYANPAKWADLLRKFREYPKFRFVNEVLGESYDIGSRPITLTDIKNASDLWPNTIHEARGHTGYYVQRILSVDWGGGGQSDISTTAIAIMGIKANKQIDVLYMERLERGLPQETEVQRVLELYKIFKCRKLVHDLAGARGQDVLLIHAGLPKTDIIPMWYVGGMTNTISMHKDAPHRSDVYYSLNKPTSIRLTCAAIRQRHIHFPSFDTSEPFTHDFLTFTEERREGINDKFVIVPEGNEPDDFLDAVTYGAMALWFMTRSFPDFAAGYGLSYSTKDISILQS